MWYVFCLSVDLGRRFLIGHPTACQPAHRLCDRVRHGNSPMGNSISVEHFGGLFSAFDCRMFRFRRGCEPCRDTSRSSTVLLQVSAEASVPGFRSVQRHHPLLHSKKSLLTEFHDIKWSREHGAEDLRLTAVPSCVLQNFRFPRTVLQKDLRGCQ